MSLLDECDIKVTIGGSELTADQYDELLEITVVQDSEALSMFTLKFQINSGSTDDSDTDWTASDSVELGTEIAISVGYVGSIESLITGEVTGMELDMPEGEEPATFTIRGHDRRHRLYRSTKTRSFVGMTDSDMAEQIAGEMKLTPNVKNFGVTHEYVLQDSISDLDFLKQRAEPIGYTVFVDEKTLTFGPRLYGGKEAATLTVGQELISSYFNLSTQGLAGTVVVQGWGASAKAAVTGTATTGKITSTMGTTLGADAADSAFGASSITIVDRAVDDAAVAEKLATAKIETLALKYITGELLCQGDPALKCGIVVKVTDVGTKFSGNYFVMSATHTVSIEKGYRTKLNVRRNAAS